MAGHNSGLEEGMVLHLVHADPSGGTTEAVRFEGQEPVADARVFSVADASSAAEIINRGKILVVGDIAYLDTESVHAREDKVNAAESENYPVVVTFSYGDPLDEEIRATTVSEKAARRWKTRCAGESEWTMESFRTGRRQLAANGADDRGGHEPHRRHALEFHGLLAGQFEYAEFRRIQRDFAGDSERLAEQDVSPGAVLSQSRFRRHDGCGAAVFAVRAELEHD